MPLIVYSMALLLASWTYVSSPGVSRALFIDTTRSRGSYVYVVLFQT
ncbi:hypothetical protein [Micromonospora sp. NPDC049374]